jgi:cell division protein FtsB
MEQLPWNIIIFGASNVIVFTVGAIKFYFKMEAIKADVDNLKAENKELKKQLRDLSDTLLLVKHSVDLLVIGKIKTGNNS